MTTQDPNPACLSVLTVALVALALPAGAVIYGDDDRTEPYEVTDPGLRSLADSIAVIVHPALLTSGPDGYDLDVYAYGTVGEYFDLCLSERFWDQPGPGWCSAVAVGLDTIVTSGNCIESAADCADTAFVFRFEMLDEGVCKEHYDHDDVYFCDEILEREDTPTLDYAVIRVDRPIVGHPALPIRRAGLVEGDADVAALYLMGHPGGMPLKVVGGPTPIGVTGLSGATVKLSETQYFHSNLDAFAGNSGSGVFSLDDDGAFRYVEGILVRGNTDFVDTGACWVSNVCSDEDGCPPDGTYEEATRITEVAHVVPPPCGDGLCGTAESCLSCPADCGPCELQFTEEFSDGLRSWNITGGWVEADMHSTSGYPADASGSPVLSAGMCDPPCAAEVIGGFDLTPFGSAVLSFWRFVDSSIDADDYLALWFWNGSEWNLVEQWSSDDGDTDTWVRERVVLPPECLVSDFSFGFRARNNSSDEYLEIDDLEFSGFTGSTGCMLDAECDDGMFCNGPEICDLPSGVCFPGVDPCPDRPCDEANDVCIAECGDGICEGTEPDTCPEDCIDGDGDGWVDSVDNCPETYNPTQEDADVDLAGDACDCAVLDPQAWETPGEVLELRLEKLPDLTIIRWDPPIDPGGVSLAYDTLRADDPADFVTSTVCLESDDGSDVEAYEFDAQPSGTLYAYLVRAENSCPEPLNRGSLGAGVGGLPRMGRVCP